MRCITSTHCIMLAVSILMINNLEFLEFGWLARMQLTLFFLLICNHEYCRPEGISNRNNTNFNFNSALIVP